jgi:hypothetical protein
MYNIKGCDTICSIQSSHPKTFGSSNFMINVRLVTKDIEFVVKSRENLNNDTISRIHNFIMPPMVIRALETDHHVVEMSCYLQSCVWWSLRWSFAFEKLTNSSLLKCLVPVLFSYQTCFNYEITASKHFRIWRSYRKIVSHLFIW